MSKSMLPGFLQPLLDCFGLGSWADQLDGVFDSKDVRLAAQFGGPRSSHA